MTSHLSEDQIYANILAETPLTAQETAHLATCAACQTMLQGAQRLETELVIARRSKPAQPMMNRYYQLFEQVQTKQPVLQRVAQWLTAQLSWDSRQQPALQGVRRAGAMTSYRMLYLCAVVEVEMLVESRQQWRRLDGEIIPVRYDHNAFPALIQLHNTDGELPIAECETDSAGRYGFASLPPAQYRMMITLNDGASVEIEQLTLT